ncbi:MAG: polysaccharide deacetylase family protein [Magnetococcales bacterium]|nr:polysaccharide deacetylase family protein [Magnetococcales bacterium]
MIAKRFFGLLLLVWSAFPFPAIRAGECAENRLFLTFDDGPREGTREILELLVQEQVPGTFFLVGEHFINAGRKETFKMLLASPLVQIANHSLTHAHERYREFYGNPEGMVRDFTKNNAILGFNQPPFVTRLPSRIDWRFDDRYIATHSYPAHSDKGVPEGVAKLFAAGFVIYGWDIEWHKKGRSGPLDQVETVLGKIKNRFASRQTVKPGKVVLLMHDFHFNSPEAIGRLRHLVRECKREGYAFSLMREY